MDLKSRLNDPTLFKTDSYIKGEWVGAQTRFQVINPANMAPLAEVADIEAEGAHKAVKAAHQAFQSWKKVSPFEREVLIQRWHDLILENKDDLATLLTSEMGKPFEEAKGEIDYGAGFVTWSAQEAKRLYGETIPVQRAGTRGWTIRQPVGVVGCITPWNFPAAMITRKCAPALAAGCTIVIKPAEDTPLTALALAELADRAGFPPGVFNMITGEAKEIGPVLTGSDDVAMIGFTGSTEVGKLLMEQAAKGVKRVALELGGNAPFIIMDDADLDKAVAGVIHSKFRAGGQTCVCANRIIVQEGVADAFLAKLKPAIEAVKVGDGFDRDVKIGPVIHLEALERIEDLVRDAQDHGGTVLSGGHSLRARLGGAFFEPTLIEGASSASKIWNSEIFGPVASVYRAKDEADILAMANNTPYGLAAYVYTRDIGRVYRLSEGLDYGMVAVNAPSVGSPATPFGGVKQSGIGREGGKWGVEEFTNLKFVLLGDVE
ncbi:NAD-dependent succinate-semialdehyde dehydrogenase [Woodsholea maritima]|uniref:NAD-dependent succinate-semialdehyde dehydrogenase n=1 Tax=Woodsholea maritima TaxID=240237 RepID=UPI00035D4591|nr:NAD-dependent succinate-semialdehyde dehydrogenase [Woodsholea maritima]